MRIAANGDVVPGVGGDAGDYVKFGDGGQPEISSAIWWWAKMAALMAGAAGLAAVFIVWIGPYFMDKVKELIVFSIVIRNENNKHDMKWSLEMLR